MGLKDRLNVVIFAQYYPPDLGGSATRVQNVAKGLFLNGCDVTVVAAFPHYPYGKIPDKYKWKPMVIEYEGGLRVIRTFIFPLKSEGLLKRLLLIGAYAISSLFSYPLLINSQVIWSSSWIPSVIYSKLRKIPVALNVDDLTLEEIPDLKILGKDSIILKIGKIIYGFFYRQGDIITPISPGYINVISSRYGISKERFRVVLAGVDLSTFYPKSRKTLNSNEFVVLYIGALSIAYDFDQIIQAAKFLINEKPDVLFIIQGSGEEYAKIRQSIKESNLKNVILIDKIVSRFEVANVLNSANVLILPLKTFNKPYLGLSTKIYEYQAVGKPIICCAEGAPAEYVARSQSGVIVHPGDYRSLANKIIYLMNNIDATEKMGINGRNYVEKHVSIMAIGKNLKVVLLKLIYTR